MENMILNKLSCFQKRHKLEFENSIDFKFDERSKVEKCPQKCSNRIVQNTMREKKTEPPINYESCNLKLIIWPSGKLVDEYL